MSQFRSVKFRVNGPEQVRAALTTLFEDGCQWGGSYGKDLRLHNDATHLFVSDAGRISYINDGDDSFFLRQKDLRLITPVFDTIVTTTVTMKAERPKTVLFGKTYFTDELEARLADLEVAQ